MDSKLIVYPPAEHTFSVPPPHPNSAPTHPPQSHISLPVSPQAPPPAQPERPFAPEVVVPAVAAPAEVVVAAAVAPEEKAAAAAPEEKSGAAAAPVVPDQLANAPSNFGVYAIWNDKPRTTRNRRCGHRDGCPLLYHIEWETLDGVEQKGQDLTWEPACCLDRCAALLAWYRKKKHDEPQNFKDRNRQVAWVTVNDLSESDRMGPKSKARRSVTEKAAEKTAPLTGGCDACDTKLKDVRELTCHVPDCEAVVCNHCYPRDNDSKHRRCTEHGFPAAFVSPTRVDRPRAPQRQLVFHVLEETGSSPLQLPETNAEVQIKRLDLDHPLERAVLTILDIHGEATPDSTSLFQCQPHDTARVLKAVGAAELVAVWTCGYYSAHREVFQREADRTGTRYLIVARKGASPLRPESGVVHRSHVLMACTPMFQRWLNYRVTLSEVVQNPGVFGNVYDFVCIEPTAALQDVKSIPSVGDEKKTEAATFVESGKVESGSRVQGHSNAAVAVAESKQNMKVKAAPRVAKQGNMDLVCDYGCGWSKSIYSEPQTNEQRAHNKKKKDAKRNHHSNRCKLNPATERRREATNTKQREKRKSDRCRSAAANEPPTKKFK